jgi:molybdopterin molybdotransferase
MLPIAPDLAGPLSQTLERGLESDVLVITGGVSAGQRDLVPATLGALGVTCAFHKVSVKPGKPVWFGTGPPRGDRSPALVFGLPGNPVSGLVGFLLFVKAALAVLAGKPEARSGWVRVRLISGFSQRGDRTAFFPSRLAEPAEAVAGVPSIEPLSWHGSADLRTAAGADGFAIFPAGTRDYLPGEIVDFLPLTPMRCLI